MKIASFFIDFDGVQNPKFRPFEEDNPENLLDADGMEDEGDGEDLIGAGMEADYRAIPQLDEYQEDEFDHDDYDQMSPGARQRAEGEMNARDPRRGTGEFGLLQDSDDEAADHRPRRRGTLYKRILPRFCSDCALIISDIDKRFFRIHQKKE